MALKDNWIDRQNGIDDVDSEDINEVAHAVIDLEEIDTEMSDTSNNAVQNKVIKNYIDESIGDIEGENYGTTMQLAEGRTADDIREISMEEYNNILEAEAKKALE